MALAFLNQLHLVTVESKKEHWLERMMCLLFTEGRCCKAGTQQEMMSGHAPSPHRDLEKCPMARKRRNGHLYPVEGRQKWGQAPQIPAFHLKMCQLGAGVKSTGYSSRTWVQSQHPRSSLQLPIAPPPGNPTLSHRHTSRQNINAHKIKTNHF